LGDNWFLPYLFSVYLNFVVEICCGVPISEVVVVAGETKRKFESVYTGGTMETIGGGEILQYWHCCGVADAFDPGCEAAPHMSYDD